MKRIFIVITILVLALAAAAAISLDRSPTALAQESQPTSDGGINTPQWYNNLTDGQDIDSSIQAYPSKQMSYQGRLEIDGSPCNGPINITFRLYTVETLGTAFWTETQSVTCENGLFSVMLGAVTPLPYAVSFQYQLWLGIQPAGAAAELTPRQMLGTVPYAMNLQPGATMRDINPPTAGYGYSFWVYSDEHPAIFGASAYTNTVGVTGYAYGSYSGSSTLPAGVYGVSSTGIGVYGTSSGDNVTCDTNLSYPCLASVAAATSTDAYGVYSVSNYSADQQGRNSFYGVNNSTSWYTGFFRNRNAGGSALGLIGDAVITGDIILYGTFYDYKMLAINSGSEALESGDVVVVVGSEVRALDNTRVLWVEKATSDNASAIVGIVGVYYEPCAKSAEELEPGESCGGPRSDVTSIQPGDTMTLVTDGVFEVKVDATNGAIHAGDLLSVSSSAGVAAIAQQLTLEGYSFYAPGTIIGKALSDLDSGTGYISVLVTIK